MQAASSCSNPFLTYKLDSLLSAAAAVVGNDFLFSIDWAAKNNSVEVFGGFHKEGWWKKADCMQATYSALIMVCINNEQLERAGEVYQLTVKSGLHPDIHAYNALINAYGCDFQVGSALLVYPQTAHNHLLVAGTHTGHF